MCKHYQCYIAEDENFKTFFNTIGHFSLKVVDKDLNMVVHEIPVTYCPVCGMDTNAKDKDVYEVVIELKEDDWGTCICGGDVYLSDTYCSNCGKKVIFDW